MILQSPVVLSIFNQWGGLIKTTNFRLDWII